MITQYTLGTESLQRIVRSEPSIPHPTMLVSRREIEAEIAAVDAMTRTNQERTLCLQAKLAEVEANQALRVAAASDTLEDAVIILQWGAIYEPFMKSQLFARPGSFFATILNHDWEAVKQRDPDGMLFVMELDIVNVDCSLIPHLVYNMRNGHSSSTALALPTHDRDALHQLADYYRWPMDDLPPAESIMRPVFHRFESTDVKSTVTFVRMEASGWLLDEEASESWEFPVLSRLEYIDKSDTEHIAVDFQSRCGIDGPKSALLFKEKFQEHRLLNWAKQWCHTSIPPNTSIHRFYSNSLYSDFAPRILAVHELIKLGPEKSRIVFVCEKHASTVVH